MTAGASGCEQLDDLFDTWLFTAEKPALPAAQAGAATARSAASPAPSWTQVVRDRGLPERY